MTASVQLSEAPNWGRADETHHSEFHPQHHRVEQQALPKPDLSKLSNERLAQLEALFLQLEAEVAAAATLKKS
jgi:hypothetical protein